MSTKTWHALGHLRGLLTVAMALALVVRVVAAPVVLASPGPGADARNFGGERVALYPGVDLGPTQGALKGNRFNVEVGVPVYQRTNAPGLKQDWAVQFGWRRAF